MSKPITQERVRQLFDYDQRSGALVWRKRPLKVFKDERAWKIWNTRYAGQTAGSVGVNGYVLLAIRPHYHYAHRLAFLYEHGWLPKEIDHINGDRSDNRIENLRAANRTTNCRNSCLPKTNTTGRIGVYRQAGKWRAVIYDNNCKVHLGYFEEFDDACAAREKAEQKYGYHVNHGRSE